MTSLAKGDSGAQYGAGQDLNDISGHVIFVLLTENENINNNDGMDNFASITVGLKGIMRTKTIISPGGTIDAINEKMDEYGNKAPV